MYSRTFQHNERTIATELILKRYYSDSFYQDVRSIGDSFKENNEEEAVDLIVKNWNEIKRDYRHALAWKVHEENNFLGRKYKFLNKTSIMLCQKYFTKTNSEEVKSFCRPILNNSSLNYVP